MTVLQDVRYGLRGMRRAPGFTAVVVLSLALGIGASTAVFRIVNALMLRELPVRDPDELVEFLSRYPGDPRMNRFDSADYEHYRERSQSFSEIMATAPAPFQIGADRAATEAVIGECVGGDFFLSLGVRPAIGRLIERDDDRVDGDPAVAVLSWTYWRSRYGLNPSVIGTKIVVNGVPATIVGVTSREFYGLQLGRTPALWVPFAMARLLGGGGSPPRLELQLLGRLKPGVPLDHARAEMRVLDRFRTERMAATSKDPAWGKSTLELESASAGFAGLRDALGSQLLVLMAIVAVLLLVACLNIATMLAARGTARRHEMRVRVALGAGRIRLVRQLFTESLLFSTAGAALGMAFAGIAARTLLAAWPVDSRSRLRLESVTLEPDATVLLFSGGVTVVTAIVFSLAPAWNAFGSTMYSGLRQTGTAGETRSRRLFEQSLVVAQVACSVVLATAAVLLVQHVSQLRTKDTGFQHDSVLLITLDPGGSGQPPEQLFRVYQELLQRMRSMPGVRYATMAAVTPIQGGAASRFVDVEGFQEPPDARRRVAINWIGPQYFDVVRTPLLAGRDFADTDEKGPLVAIINQRTARHYFGERNPLGRRFTLEGQQEPYEIVGLADDAKYASLHEPAPQTVYLHAFQGARGRVSQFALRLATPPAGVAAAVRRAVDGLSPPLTVGRVRTLREQVDASIVAERLMGTLSSALGTLGTLLAAMGLYGLLAYTVASRTREIGIRMMLGATRRDITTMVLRSATVLVALGLLLGVPLALWSRGFAASLVPNLPVGLLAPIASAAAAIFTVALVAASMPANHAAAIHPAEALKDS